MATTHVGCDAQGVVSPKDVLAALNSKTAFVVVTHASNVTGAIQPIAEIGAELRKRGVPFVVDAAQTAGELPFTVDELNCDLLAAPGHKGLLGPLGTGGLYIRPGVERRMTTIREGGTGSISEHDTQPDFLPDRFEPGSHNAIGIIGLSEGVDWILQRGVEIVWKHEQDLMRAFLGAIEEGEMPGVTLFGPQGIKDRWVDRLPNAGKTSGAFSSGWRGQHPFILMSWRDDLGSVSTLTHELGHSIHSYYTWQTQPVVYSEYSSFVAEVASNFNQALMGAYLLEHETD